MLTGNSRSKNCNEIFQELFDGKSKHDPPRLYNSLQHYPCTRKCLVHNWQYRPESDPRDGPNENLRSAYKRLGCWIEDEEHWTSTTKHDMYMGRGIPQEMRKLEYLICRGKRDKMQKKLRQRGSDDDCIDNRAKTNHYITTTSHDYFNYYELFCD